jgi:two-component system, response regulator PdtaR
MCELNVLIVEDEALVAAELELLVEESGHHPVGSAIDSEEAVALAESTRPDLAFVDVHLSDGPTGIETARRLNDLGVRVIFMTANPKRLPADGAGALGIVPKPYAPGGVRQALEFAEAVVEGRPPPEAAAFTPWTPTWIGAPLS